MNHLLHLFPSNEAFDVVLSDFREFNYFLAATNTADQCSCRLTRMFRETSSAAAIEGCGQQSRFLKVRVLKRSVMWMCNPNSAF